MTNVKKMSEYQKLIDEGKATLEAPRRPLRDKATGQILAQLKVDEPDPGLPVTIITAIQSNQYVYNDTGVEEFYRKVKSELEGIVNLIKSSNYSETGIAYQQFMDFFEHCRSQPTETNLSLGIRDGIRLYAELQHLINQLSEDLAVESEISDATADRICAVYDSNINVFFSMIILNLAAFNKIEGSQGQLRTKLAAFEDQLKSLLKQLIYPPSKQNRYDRAWELNKTLYAWLLLNDYSLSTASLIYRYDDLAKAHTRSFDECYSEVLRSTFELSSHRQTNDPLKKILSENFTYANVMQSRVAFARRICFYLKEAKKIRGYIDQLTDGADNESAITAAMDIRPFIMPVE